MSTERHRDQKELPQSSRRVVSQRGSDAATTGCRAWGLGLGGLPVNVTLYVDVVPRRRASLGMKDTMKHCHHGDCWKSCSNAGGPRNDFAVATYGPSNITNPQPHSVAAAPEHLKHRSQQKEAAWQIYVAAFDPQTRQQP